MCGTRPRINNSSGWYCTVVHHFINATCITLLLVQLCYVHCSPTHRSRFGLCIPFIGSGPTHWKTLWSFHSFVIRCIATDCCVWTDQLKTPLVIALQYCCVVTYHGNQINKPLHSNGHLSIVAHVGGCHTHIHRGHVWLIHLFPSTFRVRDYWLVPILKSCPLRWLCPVSHCNGFVYCQWLLSFSFWQRVLVGPVEDFLLTEGPCRTCRGLPDAARDIRIPTLPVELCYMQPVSRGTEGSSKPSFVLRLIFQI
jgi:hypothetical protein